MNKLIKTSFLFLLSTQAFAWGAKEDDSLKTKALTFSGYLETYYSYDLGNPETHERPAFFYNFTRHNEVNLNLGLVKANYNTEKVRGNFALMAGTYAQYNLASEQGLLKNVFEANVGVKISKTKNLWVDAGIMPSHIGFESAIGKDCWNLTRGMLAENSPYYESGVKIGHTSQNDKWYMAAMYLNGWQHIQRPSGNQTPALGTQLTYKPNTKHTLNWSTFVGNDKPDTAKQMRIFNNLYAILQLTPKLGLTTGFDIGMQQSARGSNTYEVWYTPVILARYTFSDHFKLAARGEYYSDAKGVIIVTGSTHGFQTLGYSLNLDYSVSENIMFRIEGRGLHSKDAIFSLDKKPSHNNYFVTSSLALSF